MLGTQREPRHRCRGSLRLSDEVSDTQQKKQYAAKVAPVRPRTPRAYKSVMGSFPPLGCCNSVIVECLNFNALPCRRGRRWSPAACGERRDSFFVAWEF